MPEDVTVTGPQLSLRYPGAQDAPRLFELACDPEVTKPFAWGPYEKQEQAADWIASTARSRGDGIALEFVIADAADQPVGAISLLELSRRDRRAVIGIWLGRPYWGAGIGDEAQKLLAHLAFGPLRLARLGAWVDVNNEHSQRAFDRLGFTNEGVLRAFQRHYGRAHDLIAYSLLREEFERSPLAAVEALISGECPPAWVCDPW